VVRKIKRLIVNMPPRALKSHAVSVAFVAWLLGHDPTRQIICASYGQELADKHARDCRTLMASSFFIKLFPKARLSPDKQAVNDFMTTEQGFRMSTSVTGVLTGRGADVIILDDPLKPEEALSETRRNSVNDWYSNTLLSRLNNKETGVIIIVMQRLHQDDLVGHVMEQGNWDVLSFPAIAEEDETHIIESPWGKRTLQRKAGEILQPERESKFTLDIIRKNTGEYDFASQYQQSPMPLGGAIIKTQWLRYYDLGKLPERFTSVLQSWDTANKSGDLNDFSVCTTWGVFNGFYYLLHVFRQRLNYPDLKRAVQDQAQREHAYLQPANTILIEGKASGTQLIQDLQAEGVLHVTSYDPPPGSDKLIRLYSQSAEFENGRVLLPSSAQAAPEELAEITAEILIAEDNDSDHRRSYLRSGPFGYLDSDFSPASPAQGPFLELLVHAPEQGLRLVRRLVDHAIAVKSGRRDFGSNVVNILFLDGNERTFPWTQSYEWSREMGSDSAVVTSALMALEAWAHRRVDAGEPFETVLVDVLGPANAPAPAAYLLVAVDLLLSHWPESRTAAIPFLGCPEILCMDRQRIARENVKFPDIFDLNALQKEPAGLANLASRNARPSRRWMLDQLLGEYAFDDENRTPVVERLQRAVARLGLPKDKLGLLSPALMAVHALNRLDPKNYQEKTVQTKDGPVEVWEYVSPASEADHLQSLDDERSRERRTSQSLEIQIRAAFNTQSLSSPALAAAAVEWALKSTPTAKAFTAGAGNVAVSRWSARDSACSASALMTRARSRR